MRCLSSVLILCLALPAAIEAQATDRVELHTGDVFFGRVLRKNDREVSIQLLSGGFMSFRASQVREIRARSLPSAKTDGESIEIDARERELEAERRRTAAGAPRVPNVDLRSLDAPLRIVTVGPRGSTTTVESTPSLSAPAAPIAPAAPGDPATPAGVETRTPAIATGARASGDGFSVVPPAGFVAASASDDPDIALYFRDPVTQATFVVSTWESSDELVSIKKKVAQTYATRFEQLRMERDSPLEDVAFDGWAVEVSGRLGSVHVRQLQTFVRAGPRVLLLTYSASGALWPHYQRPFEDSLRSLTIDPGSFSEAADSAAIDESPTGAPPRG